MARYIQQLPAAITVISLMLCSLLLSGCEWLRKSEAAEAREFSQFSGNAIDTVRRVVIMPIYLDERVSDKAKVVEENLIRSLTELNRFEVLTASHGERDELFADDPLRSNRLGQTSLRLTRERFGADAVVLLRVNHWQSYDPVAVSISCAMVDCRDGKVVWNATGMWDAGIRSTQDDIKEWYYDRKGKGNEVVGGWELMMSSPRLFTRYVSDRLAASVLSQPDDHH